MNLGLSIRTVGASILLTGFILFPRLLIYLGLTNSLLTDLTSMWATFIIVLIAILLLLGRYVLRPRYMFVCIVVAMVIAFVMASYFGG